MATSERSELRTILTADLEGFSSALAADEEGVIRLLIDRFYTAVEKRVADLGGAVFRKEGDAVWCTFTSALAAVRAGVRIQEDMSVSGQTRSGQQLSLRIGIHLGEVVLTPDGEILGNTLSIAKRLESGCPPGALRISEEVHEQVAGRHLDAEFVDLGTVELKGAGPRHVFEGRLSADRLERLRQGRRGGPSIAPRLVLAADLATLPDPAARTRWEREAFARSNALEGQFLLDDRQIAWMVFDSTAGPVELLASGALRGPRLVVALGDVLVQCQDARKIEGLYGEVIEEALHLLRDAGLEVGTILWTGVAARALAVDDRISLEAAGTGRVRRGDPFYRQTDADVPRGGLSAHHRPVSVSAIARVRGATLPIDLVAGVSRPTGATESGGRLSTLAVALHGLGGSWTHLAGRFDRRALRTLEGDPDVGLALALAALASRVGYRPPPRTVAIGTVAADGSVSLTDREGLAGRLDHLVDHEPALVLVGAGGGVPERPGLHRFLDVDSLAGVVDWIEKAARHRRLDDLVAAQAARRLAIVLPDGVATPEELESLRTRFLFLSGVDDEATDLRRAAEDAEGELGRESLLAAVRQWASILGPSELLVAIEELDPAVVVSLFPDPRLAGLAEDEHLALGGSLDRPETAALTEADLEAALDDLGTLVASGRRHLIADPLLYVAADAGDPALVAFHRALVGRLRASGDEPAFLVARRTQPADVRRWERRGVRVFRESPVPFLRRLALAADQERLAVADRLEAATRRIYRTPQKPYKFLDYYEATDRSIFFGRSEELDHCMTRLLSQPVLVLYGRSGAGKTSLIQAGLLPRLLPPRNLTLVLRALGDPIESMKNGLLDLLRPSGGSAGLGDSTVPELVELVASRISGHLVLVLDQFEEFFVRLDAAARAPIRRTLAGLVRRLPPSVHLLISLREDFLPEMAELEDELPTFLDNRFRLGVLTEEQARQAIREPAHLFGLTVAAELEDRLIEEMSEDGVDPPQLQIVLDRLDGARGERTLLDLTLYEELGGVRRILIGYLREIVREGLGTDGDLARAILKAMVTPRGTKAVIDAQQLSGRVSEDRRRVVRVLEKLVRARLVRTLSEGDDVLYELSHEHLIEEIQGWWSEVEVSLRHARMVLASEMENWRTFGSLLSSDRLAIIARERHRLELTDEESSLLVRAAAIEDRDLEGWLSMDRVRAAGTPVLVALLDDPEGVPDRVARRILEDLFRHPVDDRTADAMRRAAGRVGNPTLLADLSRGPGAARSPALLDDLRERVRRRFFEAPRMVDVPGGPAVLGSTVEGKEARIARLRGDLHDRILSEPERRTVEVGPFRIDRLPVTNDEFAEFRPEHAHRYPPGEGRHPAVYISWYEARDYAAWLGKELPTEEEWEKAARGTDGRRFPWGDAFDPERLNSAESGRRHTTPVDAFPLGASPYGCLDMAGNVWEWTASDWSTEGPFKVQKGGSAVSFAPHQQASARFEGFPDFILQYVGFRLVHRPTAR